MENNIYEFWSKVLTRIIISLIVIYFISCCKEKQDMSVSVTMTRFPLESPLLYVKDAPPTQGRLSILYTVKVIKNGKKQNIDFDNFIYEENESTYQNLNLVNPRSDRDSLNLRDTLIVQYYSNKHLFVMLNLDSLELYKQRGIKLAIKNKLFYKNKNTYIKLNVDTCNNFFLYIVDKNGKWIEPIEIRMNDKIIDN